jgi:predicted  nucleic acid-binding Zn-ribbon protein
MPEITKNIIDKENNILEIEKNLANLKNDFTNSFNSLEDKIKELENVNSLLVDTIEVLNSKLKNTIFRS